MLVRIAALNWCENSGSRLCTLACTVLVRRGAEVLWYHLECSVPVHESTDLARKLLFVWKINEIARLLEWFTGREVFDPTVYYFDSIPTIIHPFTIVWVSIGAVLIAILASVLPSLRAARMHPVEALRYE